MDTQRVTKKYQTRFKDGCLDALRGKPRASSEEPYSDGYLAGLETIMMEQGTIPYQSFVNFAHFKAD